MLTPAKQQFKTGLSNLWVASGHRNLGHSLHRPMLQPTLPAAWCLGTIPQHGTEPCGHHPPSALCGGCPLYYTGSPTSCSVWPASAHWVPCFHPHHGMLPCPMEAPSPPSSPAADSLGSSAPFYATSSTGTGQESEAGGGTQTLVITAPAAAGIVGEVMSRPRALGL